MQLRDLLSLQSYGLKHLQGSLDLQINSVKPPEHCAPHSLVFVSSAALAETALARGAIAIVQTPGLDFKFAKEVTLFEAPSVPGGLAMILPFFDQKARRFEKADHHFVHSTARVASDVIIGHGTHVGARTVIGAGTRIGPNTTIENDCTIGEKCTLHAQVFVGAQTEIGNRCEIHPHTTLGSDGFGYVTDPKTGTIYKIPQIGIVVLEDDVEIGANCAIDRATMTETRIKSGAKLDNLIHIAHNCEIGENSFLTAGFMTAGSTKIGKRFKTGGQCATTDHITIADDVTLAGRTAVMNDITEAGMYGGFPAVHINRFLKIQAAALHLPEIWKFWRRSTKNLPE